MDNSKVIEFNKELLNAWQHLFTTGMSTLAVMQEQAAKMVQMAQSKGTEGAQSGGAALEDWMGSLKRGQDEFNKLVHENFRKASEYLDTLAKK
jgi:hypothetical protein